MNTQEVADKLVKYCRQGQNLEAIDELYSDSIVSVEPKGSPAELTEGKVNVVEKTRGFFKSVEEVHSGFVSDPIVCGNHFTISMGNDITFKGQGRMNMEEIGVYEVKEGKIVKEHFFFSMG